MTDPRNLGWALIFPDGSISVPTVSSTERAAKVNALAVTGTFATRGWTDSAIEEAWLKVQPPGSRIARVEVKEAPDGR